MKDCPECGASISYVEWEDDVIIVHHLDATQAPCETHAAYEIFIDLANGITTTDVDEWENFWSRFA